jgi:hypothetical protein
LPARLEVAPVLRRRAKLRIIITALRSWERVCSVASSTCARVCSDADERLGVRRGRAAIPRNEIERVNGPV